MRAQLLLLAVCMGSASGGLWGSQEPESPKIVKGKINYQMFPFDYEPHFTKLSKEVKEFTGSVTPAQMKEFSDASQAFVIRQSSDISRWRAMEKWSDKAYLIEKCRTNRIPVEIQHQPGEGDEGGETVHMNFARFLNLYDVPDRTASLYAAHIDIPNQLPELVEDYSIPSFLGGTSLRASSDQLAWFGAGGEKTPCHYEVDGNIYAVVHGSKKFTLYPPTDLKHLYPYMPDPSNPTLIQSRADISNPDTKAFPLLAKATRIEVTVNAGDVLFIPAFWWSEETSAGPSGAVSFMLDHTYDEHIIEESDAAHSYLHKKCRQVHGLPELEPQVASNNEHVAVPFEESVHPHEQIQDADYDDYTQPIEEQPGEAPHEVPPERTEL